MEWAQILVIILSVFLAIFLLLAIILAGMLIKVTQQIKRVTESAQRTADHIEDAARGVGKVTSPIFIMRLVKRMLRKHK